MTWTCPRCGDCCGGDVPEGAAFILCGSCGYQDLHPSTCRAEIRFSKLAGWTVADSLAEADRLEREAAEIERRIAPDAARAAALTARVLALREGAMRPAVDAIAAFFLAAARPDPAPPPCSHDWRRCDCDVPGCTTEVCETCSMAREGRRQATATSQSPGRERWSNFAAVDAFASRPSRYVLDEHGTPVPTSDWATWAMWCHGPGSDNRRLVAYDEVGVIPFAEVSTVFLGIDHAIEGGPPVLWKTMVFGGPLDGEQERYRSLEDARAGHAAMVRRVREAGPNRAEPPPRPADAPPVLATGESITINYDPSGGGVLPVKNLRSLVEQIAKERRPNRVVADDRDSTPPAPNCVCCRTPAQWGGLAWVCPRCGRVPPSPRQGG